MNNNIQEDYVSYEVAKALKEKGFEVATNFYFIEKDYADVLNKNREMVNSEERFSEGDIRSQLNKHLKGRLINRNQYSTTSSRPTTSLAIKWIRENFGVYILPLVEDVKNPLYQYVIKWHDGIKYMESYNTESENAAILYTLKHLI